MPRAGANYQPVELIQSHQRTDTVIRIEVDQDGTTTVLGADDASPSEGES